MGYSQFFCQLLFYTNENIVRKYTNNSTFTIYIFSEISYTVPNKSNVSMNLLRIGELDMEATIFNIKHFAVHDGPGIRTTVFFKGCPLRCIWCHNPEGLKSKGQLGYLAHKCVSCGKCSVVCPTGSHFTNEKNIHKFNRESCTLCGKCVSVCSQNALSIYGKIVNAKELLLELLEDNDFYQSSGGGITLSGGECLMQADFCSELLALAKQEGLHTSVDTCGFVEKEAFDKVMPYTDLFLYDVKAFNNDVHIRCTGQSNKIILENLSYIDKCGKKTEIRIPFVPKYNDIEIEPIGMFLKTLSNITAVRVLPYHNYARTKYKMLDMPEASPSTLPTNDEIKWSCDLLRSYNLTIAK